MKRHIWKLRPNLYLKSVFSIVLLIIVLSLTSSIAFIRHETQIIKQELLLRGISIVKNLSFNCGNYLTTHNKKAITTLAEGVLEQQDTEYLIIYDKKEQPIFKQGNNLAISKIEKNFKLTHTNDSLIFTPATKLDSAHSTVKNQNVIINEYNFDDYASKQTIIVFDISTPIYDKDFKKSNESLPRFADDDDYIYDNPQIIGVARIGISLRTFLKNIAIVKYKIIIMTIAIIIIAIFITILIVRGVIAVPIKKLLQGTRKIIGGNLDHQIEVKTNDEIGEFTAYFNKMTVELKNTISELKRKYDELAESQRQLKAAQDSLIKSEKLKVLGEFTSGIVHEVKNPLVGILGSAELIAFQETDPDKLELLNVITSEGKRLQELIGSILSYAKKKEDMKLEPLNINAFLEKNLTLWISQLIKSKVSLKHKLEDNLPLINVDPQRLYQVLLNFVLNARDAMIKTDGGSLTITTHLRQESEKQFVDVKFTDTGEGILEENLKNVFLPLFTTKETGTGLGLSICKEMIEKMQGVIGVTSTIGEGTTFFVSFEANINS